MSRQKKHTLVCVDSMPESIEGLSDDQEKEVYEESEEEEATGTAESEGELEDDTPDSQELHRMFKSLACPAA